MAGYIAISKGNGVGLGSAAYTAIVDAARHRFPPGTEQFAPGIYGMGDATGQDLATLDDVEPAAFNAFYRAIRATIEATAREWFDAAGKPRPTPYGGDTMAEIVTKLEADPRFDPRSRGGLVP